MKLAIVAVYLVSEGNERLLDVHLDRIERHTRVPYAIYAAANRLSPALLPRLAGHPRVKLPGIPITDARGSEEHAYYLERLIAAAVDDGATHVATLHVDSFPVRDDWVDVIADRLERGEAFAAIERDAVFDRKPLTACILLPASFYLRYRPTLLLGGEARASAAYLRYASEIRHVNDSGVGYGFLAYREELPWWRMERSNRGEDHHHFGSVYADLVFHLSGAAWEKKDVPGAIDTDAALRARQAAVPVLRRVLPVRLRKAVKRAVSRSVPALDLDRMYADHERAFAAVLQRLCEDPDDYLSFLRFGSATAARG